MGKEKEGKETYTITCNFWIFNWQWIMVTFTSFFKRGTLFSHVSSEHLSPGDLKEKEHLLIHLSSWRLSMYLNRKTNLLVCWRYNFKNILSNLRETEVSLYWEWTMSWRLLYGMWLLRIVVKWGGITLLGTNREFYIKVTTHCKACCVFSKDCCRVLETTAAPQTKVHFPYINYHKVKGTRELYFHMLA